MTCCDEHGVTGRMIKDGAVNVSEGLEFGGFGRLLGSWDGSLSSGELLDCLNPFVQKTLDLFLLMSSIIE
jgi:hypothetical protein